MSAAGHTNRRPLRGLRQRTGREEWQWILPIAHEGMGSVSERRYTNCCQDKTLIEEGTKETRRWRPRCGKSLLFYARQLGQSTWRAQKATYGKEIEGKCLVLDWTRAMLQAKVTNRQHARTSRLRAATSPFHFGWPEIVHMTDSSIRYYVHSHPNFTSVHIQIARYTI